jgi:COMPASS component SWD3
VDADEYWRSSRKRNHRRSPSPIARPSIRDDLSQGESDDLAEDDVAGSDENRARDADNWTDRSATPLAPPLPPKPEHLNYKEKFVMRGHLRGVSAVQFSPDCSMIASAGIYYIHDLVPNGLITDFAQQAPMQLSGSGTLPVVDSSMSLRVI